MIFTFSGTGNSYYVAKKISDATGVKMVDLAAATRYERFAYDAKGEDVGFVFPVYYYGLPSMVARFAENVQIRNPGHVFCVLTCAGESGAAGEMLQEKLGKRLTVDAYYDVVMPENAVFYENPPSEEEAKRILDEGEPVIEGIVRSVVSKEKGDFRTVNALDTDGMYAHYEEDRLTEHFHLNDKCIECRICEDVCPEQIIKVYHRKPVWDEEKCSMCMSCLNLCPKQAIEFGDTTEGRNRYHHPIFYERIIGIPLKF